MIFSMIEYREGGGKREMSEQRERMFTMSHIKRCHVHFLRGWCWVLVIKGMRKKIEGVWWERKEGDNHRPSTSGVADDVDSKCN